MQAAKYSIEPTSIPAHPDLPPESNVAVRQEKNGAAVEERRDATLFPIQTAHQETQEIRQTDMEVVGSGAGDVEVGASMAKSAPSLSDSH